VTPNLHPLLATFSYGQSRRLIEIGLLVGLIGSVVIAYGGMASRRRTSTLAVGGVLLAIGLGLVLLAVHFGVSPFRR
jgi:L-cystine uptake protein TcyP (sodium:dicarboxylate symporter family)